jgi:hypothetical protein
LENMVSNGEIVKCLLSMLKILNFNITTITSIRQQLEHDLCVDLSPKKTFICEQVDLYV